jgi:hypothetical protein
MPMRREQVAAALKYLGDKADLRGRAERAFSLDPQEQDLADVAVEGIASFAPGVSPLLAARDVERARRANDPAGMAMASMGAIPGGKLAGLLKRYDPTRAEIFIGKSAKTWNQKQADRAAAMEAVGVNPEEIWKETGTFRAPDGQWRQEISDLEAKGKFTHLPPSEQRLSDVALEHPELSEAYSDLGKIQQFGLREPKQRGSYEVTHIQTEEGPKVLGEAMVVRGPDEDALRSAALHEMQHAVQRREGFERGGSLAEFKNKPIPAKLKDVAFARSMREMAIANKMRDLGYPIAENKVLNLSRGDTLNKVRDFAEKDQQLKALLGEYLDLNAKLAKYPDKGTQYARLLGEVEARAVQARQDMTPEERRATFPLKSYDIPIEQITVRKK